MRTVHAAVAVVVALVATLAAQSRSTSAVTGTIVDTAINPLPGAALTVTGPERRTGTSDKDGKFAFGELPLGDYEVRVVFAGFATYRA